MRRPLTLILALSLLGLGPVPASACALFSSKSAECATPAIQSRCDQMDMESDGAKLSPTPDTSCCSVSNAPIPVSQQKANGIALSSSPAIIVESMSVIPRCEREAGIEFSEDYSPPPLQSLLCTFLI
jgi:hypothetical protein